MPPSKRLRLTVTSTTAVITASAASTAAAVQLPPHTRLYTDVLGATFDFLSFDELRSVMMVCRNWLTAAYAMRGLTSGKCVLLNGNLSSLLSSRLARHIYSLRETSYNPGLTLGQLRQVIAAMPFLRKLYFEPLQPSGWQAALPSLQLQSSLRTVGLLFMKTETSAEHVNGFITALSRHALLTKLHLHFEIWLDRAVSFAPLQAASTLDTLSISTFFQERLCNIQLKQIRQLVQMQELALEPFDSATLLTLLQMDGPPLRWTRLARGQAVNDFVAALLPTMPHLDQLDHWNLDIHALSSLDFLSQLPALRSLHLDVTDAEGEGDRVGELLPSLSQPLTQLTELRLGGIPLNTAQLRALLTLTPRLDSLELYWMKQLDSLSFLGPVKSTLRKLSLNYCRHDELTSTELFHLQQLTQLTEVKLLNSLCEPLDDDTIVAMTPPSTLLPSLQQLLVLYLNV